MLNYGYAIVLAQIIRALIARGLDPAFGFLHDDKPGRASLAYDVLELLRADVDRVVFEFIAMRTFVRADFVEDHERVRLGPDVARGVAVAISHELPFATALKVAFKVERQIIGI